MPEQPVKKRATHLSNAWWAERAGESEWELNLEGKVGNADSCSDSTEFKQDIFTSLKQRLRTEKGTVSVIWAK